MREFVEDLAFGLMFIAMYYAGLLTVVSLVLWISSLV